MAPPLAPGRPRRRWAELALASLDLALVYREERRFAEIAALAAEILAIFETQGVQREAIASVMLFREAATQQKTTAEVVRRLADDLELARRSPRRTVKLNDLPR